MATLLRTLLKMARDTIFVGHDKRDKNIDRFSEVLRVGIPVLPLKSKTPLGEEGMPTG